MITSRRLAAFSSTMHKYLLLMYVFLFFLKITGIIIGSNLSVIRIIDECSGILGILIILDAVWVLFASIGASVGSGVLVISPIIATILRVAVYIAMAFADTVITDLITGGI